MQQHNEITSPTVAINGKQVRRFREKLGLTQLYVASVVGVTTDTISRWEQKDKANIKQENAIKLAGALEINVETIYLNNIDVPTKERPSRRIYHLLLGVATLSLLAIVLTTQIKDNPENRHTPSSIEKLWRAVPLHSHPGGVVPVRIHIEQGSPYSSMVITEHFPKSWKLVESDPPASSLDNIAGVVRWMIKSDSDSIDIDYLVKIPPETSQNSSGTFSGSVTAGNYQQREPLQIPESQSITITPFHWADRDGNNTIDDAEVLDAFDLYDEMKGVHIDWELIEAIWDKGSYRWDEKKKILSAQQ